MLKNRSGEFSLEYILLVIIVFACIAIPLTDFGIEYKNKICQNCEVDNTQQINKLADEIRDMDRYSYNSSLEREAMKNKVLDHTLAIINNGMPAEDLKERLKALNVYTLYQAIYPREFWLENTK